MAEQEIRINAVLVDNMSGQFKAASDKVKATSKQTSDVMQANTAQATQKTVASFASMSAAAKSFGTTIASGDVAGSLIALEQIAANASRGVAMSMGVATAGVGLAIAGITMLINHAREKNEDLKRMQKEIVDNQKANDDLMIQSLTNQRERMEAIEDDRYNKELKRLVEAKAKERQLLVESGIGYAQYKAEEAKLDTKYAELAEAAREIHLNKMIDIEEETYWKPYEEMKDKAAEDEADFNNRIAAVNREGAQQIADQRKAQMQKDQELNLKKWKDRVYIDNLEAAVDKEAYDRTISLTKARQAYNEQVISGMADILGAMAQLNTALKGDAEFSKSLAISQAIINTAVGITKAYAQGGALGFITGTAIAISGAAQVATIQSQKFATGGIVQGPATGDQVPIRANGGEMVLTADQQRSLFDMASGKATGGSTVVLQIPSSSRVDIDAAQYMVKSLERLAKDGAFDKAFALKKALRA